MIGFEKKRGMRLKELCQTLVCCPAVQLKVARQYFVHHRRSVQSSLHIHEFGACYFAYLRSGAQQCIILDML
jgi:hypothetical protein